MAKHIRTMSGPYNGGNGQYLALPILDSAAIYKGAFVRLEPGGVKQIDSASDDIGFICRGYIQPKKTGNVPLENVESTNYTGTLVKTAGSELYTAAADNTTVDMVYALCEPVLPGIIYRVQMDANQGTTTGSDVVGHQHTTDNGRVIDESDVADTISQLLLVNVPDDEADVVDVVVRECQLAGIHA